MSASKDSIQERNGGVCFVTDRSECLFEEGRRDEGEERGPGEDCRRDYHDAECRVVCHFRSSHTSCPVDETILEAAPLQYKLACILIDIVHVTVIACVDL